MKELNSRDYVDRMLALLGVEAKKSLGQNFLVSDTAIEKIHRAVSRLKPSTLIEIGPGLGSLTRGFSVDLKSILLLELDFNFARYWQEQGYKVVQGDALHWNWDVASLSQPVVLVSNLPYQISKSLVVDRCLDQAPLAGMVLMFQK